MLLLKTMTLGQQKITWSSFEDGRVSSVFRTSSYKLDCLVRPECHPFDFHWNRTFQAENAILGLYQCIEPLGYSEPPISRAEVEKKVLDEARKDTRLVGQVCYKHRSAWGVEREFWMSRESFYTLCHKLDVHIVRQSTRMRNAVEVDRQVAATLYYLTDEGRMRKTANAFGLIVIWSSRDYSIRVVFLILAFSKNRLV